MYLGHLKSFVHRSDQSLLKILLAAARKAITRNWLKPNAPTVGEWTNIVKDMQNMERLTYRG